MDGWMDGCYAHIYGLQYQGSIWYSFWWKTNRIESALKLDMNYYSALLSDSRMLGHACKRESHGGGGSEVSWHNSGPIEEAVGAVGDAGGRATSARHTGHLYQAVL